MSAKNDYNLETRKAYQHKLNLIWVQTICKCYQQTTLVLDQDNFTGCHKRQNESSRLSSCHICVTEIGMTGLFLCGKRTALTIVL